MQIQINTDKNIEGHERLEEHYSGEIHKALHRFEEKVTRVEVHFSDENSGKFGVDDKKCLMEARVAGMQPIAASECAGTMEKAFRGAEEKIKKMLNDVFEKKRDH